jgi:hypothetical protein
VGDEFIKDFDHWYAIKVLKQSIKIIWVTRYRYRRLFAMPYNLGVTNKTFAETIYHFVDKGNLKQYNYL